VLSAANLPMTSSPHETGATAWRAQVEKELRGADYERALVRWTLDEIEQKPVYSRAIDPDRLGEPGQLPFRRGSRWPDARSRPWQLCTRVDASSPEQANADLLEDLAGGADAAWLIADRNTRLAGAGGGMTAPADGLRNGIDFGGKLAWQRVLANVQCELISLHVQAGAMSAAVLSELLACLAERGILEQSAIHLGFDPLATWAEDGMLPCSLEAARAQLWPFLKQAESLPRLRLFCADGLTAHAAGASEATELAVVLASLTETLRAADAAGHDLAAVAARTDLRVGVGREVFLEVAKIRALRELWTRVCTACEIETVPAPFVHAVASPRTLTRRDPWTNLLRSTTQAFAAAVAGADAITLLPMDAALQRPGKLARRMARNTQLILAEEGQLGAIADPAGGSFAIEAWTDELVEAGWTCFQSIESEGGLANCLTSGWLADHLADTRERRLLAAATRSEAITGVTEYAQLSERLPDAGPSSKSDSDSWQHSEGVVAAWQSALAAAPSAEPAQCVPLECVRDAAVFEVLCNAAQAYQEKRGHAPRVCLATIGELAEHSARSTFASRLFAVGGFESIDLATAEPGQGEHAVAVCLCGTDQAYEEYGPDLLFSLRELGAKHILLAGKPEKLGADTARKFRKLKLSGSISIGCDVLSVLRQLHAALRNEPAFLEVQA
jgi:methylmalonyl-CoA mutase